MKILLPDMPVSHGNALGAALRRSAREHRDSGINAPIHRPVALMLYRLAIEAYLAAANGSMNAPYYQHLARVCQAEADQLEGIPA